MSSLDPHLSRFVFATGIECSYPTVTDVQGRRVRVDQLEKTFHYHHWQQDLALVRELGSALPALRPTVLPHPRRPRPLRLGVHRPRLRRDAAAGDRADRRPVPLRGARLGRGLPEPGLARALRPLRRGPLPRASPGCGSTRRSTRSTSAPSSPTLAGFWNERRQGRSPRLRHGPQAPLPGQSAGHPGDSAGAAGRRLHPE